MLVWHHIDPVSGPWTAPPIWGSLTCCRWPSRSEGGQAVPVSLQEILTCVQDAVLVVG